MYFFAACIADKHHDSFVGPTHEQIICYQESLNDQFDEACDGVGVPYVSLLVKSYLGKIWWWKERECSTQQCWNSPWCMLTT
jgi:hypothetical protein